MKRDRAERIIVAFDGVEYVVGIEMLPLGPFGWRFRFRALWDKHLPWDWTDEKRKALLEAIRHPEVEKYSGIRAYSCLTGRA